MRRFAISFVVLRYPLIPFQGIVSETYFAERRWIEGRTPRRLGKISSDVSRHATYHHACLLFATTDAYRPPSHENVAAQAYEETVSEWLSFRSTFSRLSLNVTAHFGVAPVNSTDPGLDPDPPLAGTAVSLTVSEEKDPIEDEEGDAGGLPDYNPLKFGMESDAQWRLCLEFWLLTWNYLTRLVVCIFLALPWLFVPHLIRT